MSAPGNGHGSVEPETLRDNLSNRRVRRKNALQIIELVIDGFSVVGTIKNVLHKAREYAAQEYKDKIDELRGENKNLIKVNALLVDEYARALTRIEELLAERNAEEKPFRSEKQAKN